MVQVEQRYVRIPQSIQVQFKQTDFRKLEVWEVKEMEFKPLQDHLFLIQSFTNPSILYTVDMLEHTCTCKGFTYRGYCKHLKLLKEVKASSSAL